MKADKKDVLDYVASMLEELAKLVELYEPALQQQLHELSKQARACIEGQERQS